LFVYYYVTLCAKDRVCHFGEVIDYEMKLNEIGLVVKDCWFDLPNHYKNCKLDYFVIMSNHFQWQKSFHDRVIRNDNELSNKRDYIIGNPAKWEEDCNNPINLKKYE
jgi:hypothetical protein